jgi:hypothetical protein
MAQTRKNGNPHSSYLGSLWTEERNMRKERKRRMKGKTGRSPYKGAEDARTNSCRSAREKTTNKQPNNQTEGGRSRPSHIRLPKDRKILSAVRNFRRLGEGALEPGPGLPIICHRDWRRVRGNNWLPIIEGPVGRDWWIRGQERGQAEDGQVEGG